MKAELVQVIRTEHRRGRGVQGDPVRKVVAYHLPDGTLIGEDDSEKVAEVVELRESLAKARECIEKLRAERDGVASRKRPALTEVRATFTRYGTSVERIGHHEGCALDRGVGQCNCMPLRTTDWHTPSDRNAAAVPPEGVPPR